MRPSSLSCIAVVAALVVLPFVASCGRDAVGPEDTAHSDGRPAAAPPAKCHEPPEGLPDPIAKTDYHTTIRIEYNAGTNGLIYLPGIELLLPNVTVKQVALGRFPLALLMHARGWGYLSYEDLQNHLARNGFAVASIVWDTGSPLDTMLDHLNYLFTQFKYRDRLKDEIALIGHSAGGKHAVRDANGVDLAGFDVRAVVALAPAPTEGPADVDVPYPSSSILVMLGSGDDDCAANGAGTTVDNVRKSGHLTYDAAPWPHANEVSMDPVNEHDFTKMMIYIEGGSHEIFASERSNGDPVPLKWRQMTQGYLNAYLRWAMRGQSTYLPYFRDEIRPASLDPSIDFAFLYSANDRRVIDNFQDNLPFTNTAGGSNTHAQAVQITNGRSVNVVPGSPHATRVYRVAWQAAAPPAEDPVVIFNIPAGGRGGPAVGNITGRDFLSFRAGQVFDDPLNPPDVDQDFHVVLESGNGQRSPKLRVSDFGRIHYPFHEPVASPNCSGLTCAGLNCEPQKSEMRTILIPICEFKGIQKEDVRKVIFEFTVQGHETGKIQIDNIEFVKQSKRRTPPPFLR